MPSVEKLYENMKDRSDALVFTMNVDEEPESARAYARQKGFQFPVLLAYTFVRKQLETKGIPRNWVLDAKLVWRVDEIGFQDKDRWLEQMTARIQKASNRATSNK